MKSSSTSIKCIKCKGHPSIACRLYYVNNGAKLFIKFQSNTYSHIAIVVRPLGGKTLCRSLVICKGFFRPATPAVIWQVFQFCKEIWFGSWSCLLFENGFSGWGQFPSRKTSVQTVQEFDSCWNLDNVFGNFFSYTLSAPIQIFPPGWFFSKLTLFPPLKTSNKHSPRNQF